ncbi:undecaprenyl-diphosphate phosphatase [Reichenbachiella sp. MALMAid0571]|uniref:undecaprenyl-diphosphate phosphatase n=1 Tax=Reichenbachiella sp. MALMAid0571 TaxID=3143939 RepID=UPI0032DF3A09
MTFLEAIILGIIQGLTEFLPVSSSGHLEIGTVLLGVKSKDNLLFSIVVHGATALSTIVVFREDIFQIIKDIFKFEWNDSVEFSLKMIISMIPVGVVGVLFEDKIESFFGGQILLVGSMLLLTGLLLLFTFFRGQTKGSVTYPKAVLIGIAQAIAIMPGISRSGATISTALLLGVDKEKAAKFSFLMVLIPILGAMLLKVKNLIETPELASDISLLSLTVGFLTAFISGLLACKWMISIVKKGKLIYFAIYCFVIGGVAIIACLI